MDNRNVIVLDEKMIGGTPSEKGTEKQILYFIQCRNGVLELFPASGNRIRLKSKEEVRFLCEMLTRQSQTM